MSQDELIRFESKWNEIYTEGIEKVFRIAESKESENINKEQYIKLYTIAYDICVSKSNIIPIKLYERLLETIRQYCIQVNDKIKFSRQILFDFVDCWTTFDETVLKWFLKLFSYLTRQNFKVKKNLNLEMDLKMIFKENVYDKVKSELIDTFFVIMNVERRGEILDSSVLKKFVKFLSSIEVSYMEFLYNNFFEAEIMDNTLKFYRPLITECFNISDFSFSSYLNWGLNVIKQEEERLSVYLPQKTVDNTIAYLKYQIFFTQSKILIESSEGFKYLLKKQSVEAIEDLKKSYLLFSEDQKSQQILLFNFKNYIKDEFKNLIEKNDSQCNYIDGPREVIFKTNYVDEFISFYTINNKIITEAFSGSNMFNVCYKEVLENIQSASNKFNNSYILPFYIDKHLKRTPNNHSSELNLFIDKIFCIFPSMPDKDVFIDIHRNLLSNRILSEDFISMDVEKYLINRLKLLCGMEFTSNLEGMINDYFQNKDLNEKYKLWGRGQEFKSPVETNFMILTAEIWPKLNINPMIIPKCLQQSIDLFSIFYDKSYQKRVLKWSLHNSQCVVEGKFDKNYNFYINTIQAIILLCFNEFRDREVNLSDICSMTGIQSETELKSYLLPLITSKLIQKCESEILEKRDFIKLNKKFIFNSLKVKIITNPKNDEVIQKEKIEDDRSWAIEATIVRIMKSTKRLHHNELVKRVLEQMENFKIQIQV